MYMPQDVKGIEGGAFTETSSKDNLYLISCQCQRQIECAAFIIPYNWGDSSEVRRLS